MNFFRAVKICFVKFFDFNGRASRSEFWYYNLFYFVGFFISMLLENFTLKYSLPISSMSIFVILVTIPYIAVWTRRLHDINKSGWWIIPIYLTMIIFVGAIWYIVWGSTKSVTKGNQYE